MYSLVTSLLQIPLQVHDVIHQTALLLFSQQYFNFLLTKILITEGGITDSFLHDNFNVAF